MQTIKTCTGAGRYAPAAITRQSKSKSGAALSQHGLPPSAVPTDQEIVDYMDREHPQRCPLCGSANVEVRYVEDVDWQGYWHTGDMFKCPDCAAEGEYE